jgi:hypothetical protein
MGAFLTIGQYFHYAVGRRLRDGTLADWNISESIFGYVCELNAVTNLHRDSTVDRL